MNFVDFPESNTPIGPPKKWKEGDCRSINAWCGTSTLQSGDQVPTTIVCMELADEAERQEFLKTGKLYIQLSIDGMIPISAYAHNPFN